MKNNSAYFTAGEFAKLHHLNKRTLHYYDNIGLFSPKNKGENGYRYYTYEQSMELENILALRELGMSIEEVKSYTQSPSSACFHKIAAEKKVEISKARERLDVLQRLLEQKEELLQRSDEAFDGEIKLVDLSEEYLLLTPLCLVFDDSENLMQNAKPIIQHLQTAWEMCAYKKSCGSFISLEKIRNGDYEEYDGVFTVIDTKKQDLYVKPQGKYMRGFVFGDWNKIPAQYEKMLSFAEEYNLKLTGYAYETGINDFAISSDNDYITQIEIQYEG